MSDQRIDAAANAAVRRVGCLAKHLEKSMAPPTRHAGKRARGRLSAQPTRARRTFTKEQVMAKRESGRCWIVIHKKIYDVTDFLEEHPGGAEIITDIEWDDFETMNFEFDDADHSEEALEDMEELYKGRLVGEEDDEDEDGDADDGGDEDGESGEEEGDEDEDDEDDERQAADLRETAEDLLTPFAHFQELELPLIDKHHLSHDVVVFRFALPSPEHTLGLPIGQHIILSFDTQDGQTITRPYTPVSPRGEVGFIDFLIKLYPTGKMSNHLSSLQVGDPIRMRGPKGKLEYLGGGTFRVRKKQRSVRRLGMIAGGSGITPMFQILQAVASNPNDALEVSVLFANKSEQDIILRDALEAFAAARPNVVVHFTLDNAPEGWKHFSGFVSPAMIEQTMPPPAEDSMVFLCGPPPMIKKACVPALQALGYTRDHYFKF